MKRKETWHWWPSNNTLRSTNMARVRFTARATSELVYISAGNGARTRLSHKKNNRTKQQQSIISVRPQRPSELYKHTFEQTNKQIRHSSGFTNLFSLSYLSLT